MANEISFSFSLSANKASVMQNPVGMTSLGTLTMSGSYFVGPAVVQLQTSATLIPVGGITQPHVAFFRNLDATNYFQLQNGASGAVLCRYQAGECFPLLLDPGITLYGIANTAAVLVEYLILSL